MTETEQLIERRIVSLSSEHGALIGCVPLRALQQMFANAPGACNEHEVDDGYVIDVYWDNVCLLVSDIDGGPIMIDEQYSSLEVAARPPRYTPRMKAGIDKPPSVTEVAAGFIDAFMSAVSEQARQPTPSLTMLIHVGKHDKPCRARLKPDDEENPAGFYICGDDEHGIIDEDEIREVPLNPFWP